MPSDSIVGQSINIQELQQAFADAPALTSKYVKGSMLRFARRVSRRIKSEYLHGGQGIKGGPWARLKDKNINGFTTGADLSTLKAVNKASRIVRTHLEGAVITAKSGGFLFLSKKSGKAGTGTVFARVKSVTIPARIPFEQVWQQEVPTVTANIADDMQRAMRAAMEQRMKTFSAAVNRFANV
jgi:hypothetical protein